MTSMDTHARKVETHLAVWKARIDELSSHDADYGPNAKAAYHQEIDLLRGQHAAVEKGLRALKAAGPDGWQAHRSSLDASCAALDAALTQRGEKRSPGPSR